MKKLLALSAAITAALAIGLAPAGAIVNGGVPDGNAHPMVGELFFYVPDAVDPRFTDPGAWFTCSGTLISPTVVLTAGHCTDGVGLNGEETTSTGGDGGNDIWFNLDEKPTFDGLPPSSAYIPDRNQERYEDRVDWFATKPAWRRGQAQSHPDYNPSAFFLFDLGIVVLDQPVTGVPTAEPTDVEGILDSKEAKKELYTAVGYGLNASGPKTAEGGDERFRGTLKLVNTNGTFGIPDGTSAKFSSNNGSKATGGTCFGDSGGPIFRQGTFEIVAVTSFGISSTCSGSSGAYRIDQEDDLEWIESFPTE